MPGHQPPQVCVQPPAQERTPARDECSVDQSENSVQQGALASSSASPPAAPLTAEQETAKTTLTAAILHRLDEDVPYLYQDLRALVTAETDTAVRDAVWADPEFRSNPAWRGHTLSLQTVLRQLSPVQRLRDELIATYGRNDRDSQALGAVRAWVGVNASHCEAAIADGALANIASAISNAETEYEAISLVLFRGQLPEGPQADVERAIVAGDVERFIAAWVVLQADPTQITTLGDDPNWLFRVQTNVGEDAYRTVLSDIARIDRAVSSEAVEAELEPLVNAAVRALDELNDTWHVSDSVVLQALNTYFAQVNAAIDRYGIDDSGTAETVRNTARQRLIDGWHGVHSTTLATKLEGGLSSDSLSTATGLLRMQLVASDDAAPATSVTDTALMDLIRNQAHQVREQFDVTVYVDDVDAVQAIRNARAALREHIAESAMGAADERTQLAQAMALLRQVYDEVYATSLINEIHHGVDDDNLAREALQLLGDRLDPNARMIDSAIGQADASDMDAVADRLDELSNDLRDLAERFHDQMLDVAWVSDSNVIGLCREFQRIETAYSESRAPVCDGTEVSALQLLENHYRAIGGDLRRGILGGLDSDNADTAFSLLGLSSSTEALRSDGDARSEAHIQARTLAAERSRTVFQQVTTLTRPSASDTEEEAEEKEADRRRELRVLGSSIRSFVSARDAYDAVLTDEGVTASGDIFRETTGIDLAQVLSLHLLDSAECAAASEAAGLAPGVVTPTRDAARDITLDADDPALQYDIRQLTTYDFSLVVAEQRARQWHAEAWNDGATTVNFTQSGSREENRIVREVFKRLYGYDVEYIIHRRDGFGAAAQNQEAFLENAGQTDWLEALRTRVRSNDQQQVISVVMQASQPELDSMLADGQLMHDIRSQFDQEVYDHVYRAATGQITMGDILRENDAGEVSMWMDFGSDEEGATTGTQQFIRYVRGRFDRGEIDSMPPSQQAMLRGIFLDGDTQAVLAQEFSGSDLLTLEQLILHGGERTKEDELEVGLTDDTRGRALLDMIAALTIEERQAKLRDAAFMQRLSRILLPNELSLAMGILNASPGQEYEYTLEQSFGEDGHSFDEDKLMETLLGMPMDALYQQSNDRAWVERVDRRLTTEQKAVFRHLMAEAERLFAPQTEEEGPNESLVDDPLGEVCAPGMSDAEIERHRQHLLLTHSVRLKFAAVQGEIRLYPALQSAFNEKGEVATDPTTPNVKEELFTNAERGRLWTEFGVEDAVREQFGFGSTPYDTTRDALTRNIDPSRVALNFAFGSVGYDADTVRAAISGVSEGTLVHSWSNIKQPGEVAGGASLQAAYREYRPVYDRYQAAMEGQDPNTCSVDPALEQEYGEALARFRTFPLDTAASLSSTLRNDGTWSWLNGASARDYLSFRMEARRAILAVSSSAIAEALGIPADDPAVAMLNGVDRKARSIHSHQQDAARHQVSQPSIADYFSDTDEQLAVSFALYSGEVGESAVAQDGELAGEITAEEQTAIQARLDQFNVDVGEYRAAKSAAAEVLKWSAIAIITAISAAVTGPAGPSVIAAMVTAGAQATAVALVTEAAQGNDYDLSTEGVKSVITETAMAGLTSKGGELFRSVAANWGPAQRVVAAADRVQEWSDALDTGIRNVPWVGTGLDIGWQSARSATAAQLSGISDAAFAVVDPSNLQYGFDHGWAQGQRSIEAWMEGVDDAWVQKFREELFKNTVSAARSGVNGENASVVPGTEGAIPDATPEEQSLLRWLAGDLGSAAFEQVIDEGATRFGDGSMFRASGWDDDQVGAFMTKFAQGRATSWSQALAQQVAEERNAGITQQLKTQVRALADDPADADDMERLYIAHMTAHARSGGLGEMTPERWLRDHWQPLQRTLLARDPSASPQMQEDYRRWVLSDPTLVDRRSRQTMAQFRQARREAGNERHAIYTSSAFQQLSDEQRQFYRAYLGDDVRAMNQRASHDATSMDIRDSRGRERFLSSFRETKRQMATPIVESLAADWDEGTRQAIVRAIGTSEVDTLPSLELRSGSQTNREALSRWAEAWRRSHRARTRTPRPNNPNEVHGEFIAPY